MESYDYSKQKNIYLDPFSTKKLEFLFYFPEKGSFSIQPANISKDNIIIAESPIKKFKVNDMRSNKIFENLDQVIESGSHENILEFIKTHNILDEKIFCFSKIEDFILNKSFFSSLILILRKKKIYNNDIWKYSLLHGDSLSLLEFFQNSENQKNLKNTFHIMSVKILKLK